MAESNEENDILKNERKMQKRVSLFDEEWLREGSNQNENEMKEEQKMTIQKRMTM